MRSRFFSPVSKGISLRQSLVVFQFVIAQVLVICTIVGIKQLNYFYHHELGFDKINIIAVNIPDARNKQVLEHLKQQIQQYPAIEQVTFGLTTPASTHNWWWATVYHPGFKDGNLPGFRLQFVDTNYFRFFQIPQIAGRSFVHADSIAPVAIVNEKAAHEMGFRNAADALGQQVKFWDETYTVSGIVGDYNSQSLRSDIAPHIFVFNQQRFNTLCVKINGAEQALALKNVEGAWKAAFPDNYFEYTFLDEDLKTFYSDEDKLSRFLSLFSIIGISIGCLGVYGLVSFICIRKTKEIGVRKVLGAGITQILAMLSGEFIRLILIAALLAIPVAWYLMNSFLESYSYRVPVPWWLFALTGLGALVVTGITIGFRAVRAAMINPADSLRTE